MNLFFWRRSRREARKPATPPVRRTTPTSAPPARSDPDPFYAGPIGIHPAYLTSSVPSGTDSDREPRETPTSEPAPERYSSPAYEPPTSSTTYESTSGSSGYSGGSYDSGGSSSSYGGSSSSSYDSGSSSSSSSDSGSY